MEIRTQRLGDSGTWDSGTEGHRDAGTPGRGTRERRDVGRGDAGTRESKTWRLGDVARRGLEDVIFSLDLLSAIFGALEKRIICWKVCQ